MGCKIICQVLDCGGPPPLWNPVVTTGLRPQSPALKLSQKALRTRMPDSNLKTIWFEGEMLPQWAQLLDLAARLCPVPDQIRSWFARFSNSSGVDDSRTIAVNAGVLRRILQENKEPIIRELQRTHGDQQAPQIFAAWLYALDTILQQAATKKTCSWKVEGAHDTGEDDFGDGDVSLRRV